MTREKLQPTDNTQEMNEDSRELILHNDEENTFDFVIDTLMEVCGHDGVQAEQCALIAHYKGKCAVKNGSVTDLKPPYEEMTNRQLTVSIS